MNPKASLLKILVVIVSLGYPLIVPPAASPGEFPPNDATRCGQAEGRRLRLSMKIAEARKNESAKKYYQSLARRQKWRAIRPPWPAE